MKPAERDPSSLDDHEFERLLFASARHDPAAADVEAFYGRLNATIEGVARLSAASAGAATRPGPLLGGRAQRALAAKWLVLGALAGSAITAATLSATGAWHPAATLKQTLATARPAPTVSPSARATEARPQPAAHEPEPPRPGGPAPKPARCTACARVAAPHAQPADVAARALPGSALGAQVALLDAARTASAAGRPAEALRLAEQYRADFPNGELAPEAELVAIEALAARGDQLALAARSARFLDLYPSDPHAARVRWLAR
jgi:hypothetical protein